MKIFACFFSILYCITAFSSVSSYNASPYLLNSQTIKIEGIENQYSDEEIRKYNIKDDLLFFKKHIDQEILKNISILGPKTVLRDACEYSLTTGGKRYRPSIILMIADALGSKVDSIGSALSVEFFHTASLIADDLPCMDNDDERRGLPTLHKVYGETLAVLSTYALISAAFESLEKNINSLEDSELFSEEEINQIARIALKTATHCAGMSGVTGGQFLDLFPPKLTVESIKEVIYKKTVSLFEASFVFGWIFSGGNLDLIENVKKTAYHFGLAFQIVDDLGDVLQDVKNKRDVNMANLIGKEAAFALFEEEFFSFKASLQELNIDTPAFQNMSTLLYQKAVQNLRE